MRNIALVLSLALVSVCVAARADTPLSGQGHLTRMPPPAQQVPPPAAAAAQGGAPGGDPVAELQQTLEQQRKAIESINALNPFSESYGKGGPQTGLIATTGPMAQLQKLLAQPAVQGYLKLFSNTAFTEGVNQVMKSPSRMTLLYAELGWIVFMLIFRAWRFSKSSHWFGRLWTRLWTFLLFALGSALVVPIAVLGEPYVKTVTGMIQALTGR